MAFPEYWKALRQALERGNATEHTYRPALKALVEALQAGVTATNEPKREACGAPDFIVTCGSAPQGYIEAKDIGRSLDEAERSEQLTRYLHSLTNLILTDYLEFRWFVVGEHRMTARIATVTADGRLRRRKDGEKEVLELLNQFLTDDDIAHYQYIVAALNETIRLMAEIDEVIEEHGGWPDAFVGGTGEGSAVDS